MEILVEEYVTWKKSCVLTYRQLLKISKIWLFKSIFNMKTCVFFCLSNANF